MRKEEGGREGGKKGGREGGTVDEREGGGREREGRSITTKEEMMGKRGK